MTSGSYGVMAITLDFESNNPSSNLGRTLVFLITDKQTGDGEKMNRVI